MSLLSSLYQQQQQINQNPTSAVRTPIQNAYDNLLNAQANAQNTAKEEWGSAIGNSVNGLAKIIASSVIGNPIEKAASTRNLDNFDARQDALVRQWAMEQAKKRNDFVNQAREQLGMAKADEEQSYNRQMNDIERNDKLNAQERAYNQWLDQFGYQQEKDKRDYDEDVRRFNKNLERLEDRDWIADRNADRTYNLDKRKVELAEQQAQQETIANTEQAKARQKQLETYVATAKDLFNKGLLSNEDMIAIEKNPELAEKLIPANKRIPVVSIPVPIKSSKRMKIDRSTDNNEDNSYEILQDKDGNLAKVYKDGRIEEI